ncbi:hypothetical protein BU17DRAFT_77032 [Hysterangium stoloniferum]|nr:hypothetical protein BU17DRAFT_77032 [Hysterangium stoloniferum]
MDMNDTSLTDKPVASSAPASFPPFFRRRTLGRAPSPPTWACYEQIPPQASDSDEDEVQTASDSQSGSDSEGEGTGNGNDSIDNSNSNNNDDGNGSNNNNSGSSSRWQHETRPDSLCEDMEMDMDMGEPESPGARRQRRRKHHEPPFVYRPILTIKKSEGFVWNQDLFVPSYIKDRYIASTSPSAAGFSSSTSPVPASEFNDNYEIEVVEIRVQGNELEGILS